MNLLNLFDLYCKISVDMSDVENGVEDAKEHMTGAEKSITAKAVAIGNAIYDMGKKAATSLKQIGQYAFEVGTNFDSSMANVAAISGATEEALESLRDKAKEMGAQTKFSASESADAFTYMAMAGWKTEEMLSGIEGIMNLAAASGENLATVSDIVTDALTAFGLAAEDSGHFADVLAAASNSANTNVTMLGESFKYVAPVAGALGYSVEDVSVALGLMANSGIKASQAGTSLRSALSRMVDPTNDMWDAISGLGLAMTDAGENFSGVLNNLGEYNAILYNSDGSTKSFSDTMLTLREAFSKLDDSQKTYYATTLFGQEAMSGMLAIINSSDSDFENLTQAINNADGTASAMADTMNNNLPGAITIMKSAFEGLGIAIYENGSDQMQKFVEKITEVVSNITVFVGNGGIQDIIDKFVELSPIIAGAAAALVTYKTAMAIAGIIDTVRKATENMSIAQAALNAVMNANPFVLVATLIASIGTALVTLYMTNEDFRDKVNAAWANIKDTISNVVSSVVAFFTETVPNAGREMLEFFKSIPSMALEWGKDLIDNFVDGIKSSIGKVKDAVSNVAKTVKNFIGFSEPEEGPLSNFHTYAPDMMKLFADGIKENSGLIKNAFNNSLDFGTANVDFASSGMGTISKSVENSITKTSGVGGDIVINITSEVGGAIVARKQYRYNLAEAQRRGVSFVNT